MSKRIPGMAAVLTVSAGALFLLVGLRAAPGNHPSASAATGPAPEVSVPLVAVQKPKQGCNGDPCTCDVCQCGPGCVGTVRAVPVIPKDEQTAVFKNGYTLGGNADVGGLWASRSYATDQPFAAMYSHRAGGSPVAVLGVTRNQRGDPHDFAVVADKDGCYIQFVDSKGKVRHLPVSALEKLLDK